MCVYLFVGFGTSAPVIANEGADSDFHVWKVARPVFEGLYELARLLCRLQVKWS